jgi:hypothetical protein
MSPASPAKGVACPAKELMRREIRGASVARARVVREQNTSASSLCRGRGLLCRFRRGCEPVGDWIAASARLLLHLLPACFWSYQPSCVSPRLTDP